MGNYFSGPERLLVHPVDQHQKRVMRVKARMTVKELRELVVQAETGGEDVGALILSKSLLKGNIEVMEPPKRGEGRRVGEEVMKKLETIKED